MLPFLPTPLEIRNTGRLLWEVIRLRNGSTAAFDTSRSGIIKSFSFAPFLFFVFLFQLTDFTLTLDPGVGLVPVTLRAIFVYLMLWSLFPVFVYQTGFRHGFKSFVVIRNWLLVVNFAIALVVSLFPFLSLFSFIVALYLNVVTWFVVKDAFRISGGKAFLLWLAEIFFSGATMMFYLLTVGIDFEKLAETLTLVSSGI